MHKRFKLAQIDDSGYQCVSLSLCNEGIDFLYEDLESELKRSASKGRILFDLLLSNGYKSERFVSVYFDGNQFDFSTYEIESNINSEVENYCSSYFINNPSLLEKSVLTKPQRFLFKKRKVKYVSCS